MISMDEALVKETITTTSIETPPVLTVIEETEEEEPTPAINNSEDINALSSGEYLRIFSDFLMNYYCYIDTQLTTEDEEFFAMSIFELGLRYSSPKILVSHLHRIL